jgi:hypothetical protein
MPRLWLAVALAVIATGIARGDDDAAPGNGVVGVQEKAACSYDPAKLTTQCDQKCRCARESCYCEALFSEFEHGLLTAESLEVAVNLSCSSVLRQHPMRNSVFHVKIRSEDLVIDLLSPEDHSAFTKHAAGCMGENAPPLHSTARPPASQNSSALCKPYVVLLPAQKHALSSTLSSRLSVSVGPGAPHCKEQAAGPDGNLAACNGVCQDLMYYIDANVRIKIMHATGDDSLMRLLLGITFSIVWTVIVSVPLAIWLRRRRAHANQTVLTLDSVAVGCERIGHAGRQRGGARGHGIRTKPRRFKALKVSDWEAERGASRRRHGWVVANDQAVREGRALNAHPDRH